MSSRIREEKAFSCGCYNVLNGDGEGAGTFIITENTHICMCVFSQELGGGRKALALPALLSVEGQAASSEC